jgi:DNA-binding NtrC family response regulator
VGLLAEKFLAAYAAKHGRPARRLDTGALAALGLYDFPGNVRELANVVERAVIVSDGREVGAKDLPEAVLVAAALGARRERRPTLAELEADYIREVLAASRGNKSEAARVLGISRKNLYERLARQMADAGGQTSDVGEKPVTDS